MTSPPRIGSATMRRQRPGLDGVAEAGRVRNLLAERVLDVVGCTGAQRAPPVTSAAPSVLSTLLSLAEGSR